MNSNSVGKKKSATAARVKRSNNAGEQAAGEPGAARLDEATRAAVKNKALRITPTVERQQQVDTAFAKHQLPTDQGRANTAARNLCALQKLLALPDADVGLLLEQPALLQLLGDPNPDVSLALNEDGTLRTRPPLDIARALAQAPFKELSAKLPQACSGRHLYALCTYMLAKVSAS